MVTALFIFFILYKIRIPQPLPLLNRNCEGVIFSGLEGICELHVCYCPHLTTIHSVS